MLDQRCFFQIHLPYGLQKNSEGKWRTFNRKYQSLLPQGFKKTTSVQDDHTANEYVAFKGLTEKFILSLGDPETIFYQRNDDGEIIEFWLYGDGSHSIRSEDKDAWGNYVRKLKKLGALKY